MRFQLKSGVGSVSNFTSSDGKIYAPGDIVDLPPSYKGEAWLKPIDIEPSKPAVIKTAETVKPELEKTGSGPEPISAKPDKPLPLKPHK